MGEYATHNGQQVKIGTCENMYYLRAEQRDEISGYPWDADTLGVVRFRFPFPDEDAEQPGGFWDHGHDRGVKVPGYSLPAELSGDEHGSVQFTSSAGYVLSIPCPEQFDTPGLGPVDVGGVNVHRNGFNGQPVVSQQAFRFGRLVTLLRCGACGAMHRLDTIEDAEPVIDAFRAEAEATDWTRDPADWDEAEGRWGGSCNYGHFPRHSESHRKFLLEMAERIAAGYSVLMPEPAAV